MNFSSDCAPAKNLVAQFFIEGKIKITQSLSSDRPTFG